MWNVVLWLAGLCLCQAIIPPDFNSFDWNSRRKLLNHLQKPINFNLFNQSKPIQPLTYLHSHKFWPINYRPIMPSHGLYPYYTNNPYLNQYHLHRNYHMSQAQIQSLLRNQWIDKNIFKDTSFKPIGSLKNTFIDKSLKPIESIKNSIKDTSLKPIGSINNSFKDTSLKPIGSIKNSFKDTSLKPISSIKNSFKDTSLKPIGDVGNTFKDASLMTVDDIKKTVLHIINTTLTTPKNNKFEKVELIKISDLSSKLLKGSLFKFPRNETMIISPTLLIGRKNKSNLNDDWILSNKPINILVNQLPKKNNTLKDDKKSKAANKMYKNKSKSHKRKNRFRNKFVENNSSYDKCLIKNYERKPKKYNDLLIHNVKCNSKCVCDDNISNNLNDINYVESVTNMIDDKCYSKCYVYDDISNNNNDKNDDESETDMNEFKNQTRHPIKKRIYNTFNRDNSYICDYNLDELLPDEDSAIRTNKYSKNYYSSKKLRHNDLVKRKNQTFHYFPKVKRSLKRSCRHKNFDDTIEEVTNSLEYLTTPDYEYLSENDELYPLENEYADGATYSDNAELDINKTMNKIKTDISHLIPYEDSDFEIILLKPKTKNEYACKTIKHNLPHYKSNALQLENTFIPVTYKDDEYSNIYLWNNEMECLHKSTTESIHITCPTQQTTNNALMDEVIVNNLTNMLFKKFLLNSLIFNDYSVFSKDPNQLIKCFPNFNDLKTNSLKFKMTTKMKQKSVGTTLKIILETTTLKTIETTTLCTEAAAVSITLLTTPISTSESTIHTTNNVTIIPTTTKLEEKVPCLTDIFISPNKVLCEETTKRKCVCTPQGMVNFYSKEINKSLDLKTLLKKLITYSCEEYTPIEDSYQIASDMRPRLLSKKQKELIEDQDYGPKVINAISFDQLMMRGVPEEGNTLYVFPSTTVEVPCFTSDEVKLSPNVADSAAYKWSHANLKAITEGRILEDSNHKGSLIIQDVTLADSDNYTCNVRYLDPDSQVTVKETFIHAVKVVLLPQLGLHTNLHYLSSQKCDQELLEMFELYLPQQVEQAICSLGKGSNRALCHVEIHNPVCYVKNKQDEVKKSIDPRLLWRTDFQRSRWIRDILNEEVREMEVSLNYQLNIEKISNFVPEALNISRCTPHCQQKISLKSIEILRDSFLDGLLLPIKTKDKLFQPVLNSLNIKMITACDGGLELQDGFCVPCRKHFFSEHGKTRCLPCPPGTYQDHIGAKSCIPCPHPFKPNCFKWERMETKLIVIILIMAMIILICCFAVCCVKIKDFIVKKRRTKHKVKIISKKPEPLPPDFD